MPITRRQLKPKLDIKSSDTKKLVKKITRTITRRGASNYLDAPVEFVDSGCITLNLALSGKGHNGGWARSRIFNIVGDGSSGKTLLALEAAFAFFKKIKKMQSKIFPKVKKIIIVYNNCEGVMDFPIVKMYGQEFFDAVEWVCFPTIEHFSRDYIGRLIDLEPGTALLYIVDSWDALTSQAAVNRFDKSVEKDEDISTGYNLEKQKIASSFFSNICGRMANNQLDATLCIISQVRTKIGVTFGKKQYRAGGKALDFYTHQVAWIAEIEKMRKTKKKEKRVYGIRSRVKVERSKVSKPFREAEFSILYDYGLDNIGSIFKYLAKGGYVKIGKKRYNQANFIKHVEKNNLEKEVALMTEEKWNAVEKAFEKDVHKRKRRY